MKKLRFHAVLNVLKKEKKDIKIKMMRKCYPEYLIFPSTEFCISKCIALDLHKIIPFQLLKRVK